MVEPLITFNEWQGRAGSHNSEAWDDGWCCDILADGKPVGLLLQRHPDFWVELGAWPHEEHVALSARRRDTAQTEALALVRKALAATWEES